MSRKIKTRESFTALLSCKPIDVELRRLQHAALRKRKAKPLKRDPISEGIKRTAKRVRAMKSGAL